MYYVYIGGALVFDALADASAVSAASISQSINAAAYLDLTIAPPTSASVGDSAEVRWDSDTLFSGHVTSVTQNIDGTCDVSAVSDIDRLNDVLVRPHSTDGSVGETCPDTLAGYFGWLIEQFNVTSVGSYRVNVGVNQADRLRAGSLSVSNSSWPSTASVIDDEFVSLGGYLDYTPHPDSGTLSIYADIHDASNQLIELGENVADIKVTRSSDEMATAVIPYSGDLDISSDIETATTLATNAELSVSGLAIYDPQAVAESGYVEQRVEIDGIDNVADLVRAAIARLRTIEAPSYSIECRAVDMALYRDGYEHLRVGQAVHVRSRYHGVDEYLAVQDMALDLLDPSQTTYTLGVSYDTLTGQQSAYLRRLNGSINSAVDRVDGMAGAVDDAQSAANAAQSAADSAQSAAQSAQDAAGNAVQAVQGVQGGLNDLREDVTSNYTTKTDFEATTSSITATVTKVEQTANGAVESISKVQQDVNGITVTLGNTQTAAQNAQSAADAAQNAAQSAQGMAQSAQSAAQDAQSTAQSAQDAASSALSAAQDAQSAASDAEKVATNYLRFDSSGLCVGNMTGSLGYNANITSTEFQIRHGTTVLSSFGANTINIGQSYSSLINMCNGAGTIQTFGSNGIQISSDTGSTGVGNAMHGTNICGSTVTIMTDEGAGSNNITLNSSRATFNCPATFSQTATFSSSSTFNATSTFNSTTRVNGTFYAESYSYIGLGNATRIRGIYTGSKVITVAGTSTQYSPIFTSSQFSAIVGRTYTQGDVVLVANGDYNAHNGYLYAAAYNGSTQTWYVGHQTGYSGSTRVNYMIIAC